MKITFNDNNKEETFNIMVMTSDYIIATIPYTVENSKQENTIWQRRYDRELNELSRDSGFDAEDFQKLFKDDFDSNFLNEYGEQPSILSEDTFKYTIVDIKNQKRGPDNLILSYHDYDNLNSSLRAIEELHNGTLSISHRNSIPTQYTIS